MSSTLSRKLPSLGILVFACACEVEKVGSTYNYTNEATGVDPNNANSGNEYNFGDSIKLFSEPILKVFSVQDCQLNADMPDNVASANIDVLKVRLRSKGNSGAAKWFSKDISDAPVNFDLANLGCAVWSNFNKFIPPPGIYDHMRLETVEEGSVVHTDAEEFPLVVPSGEQSGIKIFFNPPLVVDFDKVTVCIFNYDREKSIQPIPQNNPNRYHFKPVVRAECGDPIELPIDDNNSSSSSSSVESSSSSSSSSEQSSSSSSSSQCDLSDGSDADPGWDCLSDYKLPVEDEPSFILLSPEL